MSSVLGGWGSVWRTSPMDLPAVARTDLWNKSEECESLDAFISQSWTSSAWQKYFALLMRFYWATPAVVGVVTLFTFMLVDTLGWLPTLDAVNDERFGSEVKERWCPWSMIPPSTMLVVLCLSPRLPGPRNRRMFLDALCINQVDTGLQSEAIYSLGGFVANSKDLLMLWCPSYLRRGWCLLELAVCTAAHKTCTLQFCPLFATTTWLTGFVMCLLLNLVLSLADSLSVLTCSVQIPWICRLLSILPTLAFVHMSRWRALALQDLEAQLENLRVDNAKCRSDKDLDFVKEYIKKLHGSHLTFERHVREALKQKIFDSGGKYDLNYASAAIMVSPLSVYWLPHVISLARTGMPLLRQVNFMAAYGSMALFILPALVKFVGVANSCFARPHRSMSMSIVCSICIAVVTCGLWASAAAAINDTAHRFSFGGLASCGLGALIALQSFQPWWLRCLLCAIRPGVRAPDGSQPPQVVTP